MEHIWLIRYQIEPVINGPLGISDFGISTQSKSYEFFYLDRFWADFLAK